MCLAIPSKIIKIEGDWATVDSGEHTHRANLSLVKNVKRGDYLLVHNELALNKVPREDALKILGLIKNNKTKNICKIRD